MNQSLKLIYKFIILSLLISCSSQKISDPSMEELRRNTSRFVPLRELLLNKGTYAGQVVETEGYLSFGFERSALYYDTIVRWKEDSMVYRMFGDALWIEMHPRHPFYTHMPDSFQNKIVRIKGILDKSAHGHLGHYTAELTNSFELKTKK